MKTSPNLRFSSHQNAGFTAIPAMVKKSLGMSRRLCVVHATASQKGHSVWLGSLCWMGVPSGGEQGQSPIFNVNIIQLPHRIMRPHYSQLEHHTAPHCLRNGVFYRDGHLDLHCSAFIGRQMIIVSKIWTEQKLVFCLCCSLLSKEKLAFDKKLSSEKMPDTSSVDLCDMFTWSSFLS